ncbi:MAG: hypothetical protein QM724_01485 [Flavobacteriales bacterium]
MQRFSLLALSLMLGLGAFAQSKTKEGYALNWNKEIDRDRGYGADRSAEVGGTQVPIYEARPSDVATLLRTVIPGASFKENKGVQTATGVSLPALSAAPLDVLATMSEDKKAGLTRLTMGFTQNGTALPANEAVVRDLAVKLNKAVVQQQVDVWQGKLDKAAKQQQSAQASQEKATEKVNKANSALEKTISRRGELQREISNIQADITRQDTRWQTSQNPKDLKKLTKLREKLAKTEKKLADTMTDETKQTKTANKRQEDMPGVAKDQQRTTESKEEVQRTVDALKQKLDSIR